MDIKVLLGITLTLALTTFSLPAFSQAIAESVLLGANSSTATVTAGSALNSALNQSSKQIAGRIQQQVSQPQRPKTPQSGKNLPTRIQASGTAVRSTPDPGALIVSIQGAEQHNCQPTNDETAARKNKATAQAPLTNCASQNTPAKPPYQKYKSVVTLSFPN